MVATAVGSTAILAPQAGAGAGALLSNPIGWVALGAGLLMQMDAQEQANAQRKKAYEIQTSNLAMQRDIKLSNARREVLAKQDQLMEQKLQNLISSMQQSAKVKAGAKGQMNTQNVLRLIKSGELQSSTKISQAYADLVDTYSTDAGNLFKQNKMRIEQLRMEYASEDKTMQMLMNTVFSGYQIHKQDVRQLALDDSQKKLNEKIDSIISNMGVK